MENSPHSNRSYAIISFVIVAVLLILLAASAWYFDGLRNNMIPTQSQSGTMLVFLVIGVVLALILLIGIIYAMFHTHTQHHHTIVSQHYNPVLYS